MPVAAVTVGLLVLSNIFMTFTSHAHLKNLNDRARWIAALCRPAAVWFTFRTPARA